MKKVLCLVILACFFLVTGCNDSEYNLDDQAADSVTKIHTEKSYFKDQRGRYLFLHGANVSGSTKYPATEDPISYVGKPFPLDEADKNFRQLRDMGFNTLRLLVIWEAVEPEAQGEYDEEYLDYLEQIVAKANDYGIYLFLDMHQDFFSRFMCLYYNDGTDEPGLIETMGSDHPLQPPLNSIVRGDGAPRWVVQHCLPDKNVYSSEWGLPRTMVSDPRNTTDLLPLFWGVNIFASMDVNRCFAAFFAGRDVYPNYIIDGKNIQDYLQDSFANAWLQIVARVKDYPNVIGYDLINEPGGIYVMFTLYALLYKEAKANPSGTLSDAQLLAGMDVAFAELLRRGVPKSLVDQLKVMLLYMNKLPRTAEDFALAGMPLTPAADDPYKPDLDAALELNVNFNRTYLQPFFEKVGNAIQAEDPDAIIFIEHSLGFSDEEGIFGMLLTPMLAPEGLNQIVYAPHFYTDVYSVWGLCPNPDPRDFTIDEIQLRNYTEGILDAISYSAFSLGNPPVVLGEFGTYFNFGGPEKSMEMDYIVSAHILDNYYKVLDEQMVNRTVWCYSPENTPADGEGWNKEDFSILGPDQQARGDDAYSRVMPRFTSGRLISFHYNSPLDYYEPRPGVPTPYREFEIEMGGLETQAPTEITVPARKYPDGFYVYVSGGRCVFDNERHILYWYPENDDPNATHHLRIRPPWPNYGDNEWDYFFLGEKIVEGTS